MDSAIMAIEKSKVRQRFLAVNEKHDETAIGLESGSIYGLAIFYLLCGFSVASRTSNK